MSDNSIVDVFTEWNRQVQLPGNISLSEATDILQTFASSVTDTDGDAWWNALAAEYGRLDIINPATYVGLRNHANNNEAGANDLFVALLVAVNFLPETAEINRGIRLQNLEDDQLEIPTAQTTLEGFKTGDRLVDTALDEGIKSLEAYNADIDDELPGLQP